MDFRDVRTVIAVLCWAGGRYNLSPEVLFVVLNLRIYKRGYLRMQQWHPNLPLPIGMVYTL